MNSKEHRMNADVPKLKENNSDNNEFLSYKVLKV